jgi:hypothetical protein
MKTLFRRRGSGSGVSETSPFSKSVPFTPDHPFLSGWPELPISSVLSDPSSEFARLRSWISTHSGTETHFLLRQAPPIVPDILTDFRRYAQKSQILKGFQLLTSCDKLAESAPAVAAQTPLVHPFPAGRNFRVVKKQWRLARVNYTELQALVLSSDVLRVRILAIIGKMKASISSLISLCATTNVVPPQYLAVVDFGSFNLNSSEMKEDLKVLQRHIDWSQKLNRSVRMSCNTIFGVGKMYSDGGSLATADAQLRWLQEFVEKSCRLFDGGRYCVSDDVSVPEFLEFFEHPDSIANPILVHFFTSQKPDEVRFADLTQTIITQFDFQQQRDALIVNALMSALVAPMFLPEVQFDGPGSVKNDEIRFAIVLLGHTDPLQIIAEIADHVESDYDAAIARSLAVLGAFTSSAPLVLAFAYKFTLPAFLPSRGKEVRLAIGRALNLSD